jgi:ABC-type transporter Mla subunit MlaD
MAENNIKIYTIKVDTKTGKIAVDNLTRGFVKSETALKNLNTTLQTTTKKGVSPLADSTGLAGAAVNELGRTVSDAGYGIQGMANNISQLGSLFAILIARTGGFTKALKVMGKQFVGPLGILFVFQAAVAAIEYFSRETKNAEDAVNDLDNAFGKQASQLKTYISILQESNVPLDERKELVTELNKEHKDLNIQLDEEGRLTEESTKLTDQYIKTLETKAKAQAIITRLQENYNEELERETEEIGENLTFFDKLATAFTIRKGYNADLINEEKSVRKKTEADREANEENEKLIAMLNELGVIPEINEKKEKKAAKSRKEFVAKRLSFADDILKSEDEINKQTTKGQIVIL